MEITVCFIIILFINIELNRGHGLHHKLADKEGALSFLRDKRDTSYDRCYSGYLNCISELINEETCQDYYEYYREIYCSANYCPEDQTCYIANPCYHFSGISHFLSCSADPCVSHPCFNNGSCSQTSTGYACLCLNGYSGTTCETEISLDPCDAANTKELGHLDTRSPSSSDAGLCDDDITEGWYKGYGYEMITYDPGDNTCGTKSPIWLTVSVANISSTQNITACVRKASNTCDSTLTVQTKKCGADTIYRLPPSPFCDSAYCFDQANLLGYATTWTPSSINVMFDIQWTVVYRSYGPTAEVVFKCDFTQSTGLLFYRIKWYVDDTLLQQSGFVTSDDIRTAQNTTMSEKKLQSFGKTIKCSVEGAYSINSPPGPETTSSGFYAGIKLHTPTVNIPRNGETTIKLEPTIPFGCIQSHQSCRAGITMTNPQANNACEQSQVTVTGSQRCGFQMEGRYKDYTEWFGNAQWRKNYTLTLKHRESNSGYNMDKTSYVLKLKVDGTQFHTTWAHTKIDDVTVQIYDNDGWKGKNCHAVMDPHLKTFDGRHYEMQMAGTYIFYKHTAKDTTVQIKTTSCWSPRIFCVCGVAVQAGKDVFVIDTCPDSHIRRADFSDCGDGLLRVHSHGENLYKIYLPTGTRVEAFLRNYNPLLWDVYIYPSVNDVQQTCGLCGYLDGDCSNDFSLRYGGYSTVTGANYHCSSNRGYWYPNDFSISWRIDDSESLLGSQYDHVYSKLQQWPATLQLCFCEYNSAENDINTQETVPESTCSYREYADCNYNSGRERVCRHVQTSKRRRKKRHSGAYEEQMVPIKKRSTTMTVDEATRACNETFYNSTTFRYCFDVGQVPDSILQLCILDLTVLSPPSSENELQDLTSLTVTSVSISRDATLVGSKVTGDITIAEAHRERAKSECTNEFSQNSTLREDNPDIVIVIENNNCPNECSGNGICVAGNCTCESGFAGADCSMNLSQGIEISGNSEDGFCDTSVGPCEEIEIHGDNFPENINPIGVFKPFHQAVSGETRSWLTSLRVSGEQRSRFSSIFNYPSSWKPTQTSDDEFVFGYTLAVSVDGNIYSKEITIYVHDSKCQMYSLINGQYVFTLKDGYCYVDGVCHRNGTNNPLFSCQYCNKDQERFEWSTYPSKDCVITSNKNEDSNNWKTPVAVVAPICILISICVAGFIFIKKYFIKKKTNITDILDNMPKKSEAVPKHTFNLEIQGSKNNLWCSDTSFYDKFPGDKYT